jgi:hypothetical protein
VPKSSLILQKYNPNDMTRTSIGCDGAWMKETWKSSIRMHIVLQMKKWQMGTGGGPGAPELFENWQSQAPAAFESYTNLGSGSSNGKLWLGYIYQMDWQATPPDILYAAAGSLPDVTPYKTRLVLPLAAILLTLLDRKLQILKWPNSFNHRNERKRQQRNLWVLSPAYLIAVMPRSRLKCLTN